MQPEDGQPQTPGPRLLSGINRWLGYDPPRHVPEDEPVDQARLQFDGTGGEYFRIWVVNTLLTLLTLGVYSAWAKVRKARWFARHTSLLGDRFDFHGQPLRILAGRTLALVLLLAWTQSFRIHAWLGVASLVVLCVAGPLLMSSAQRFKLANTSWRGLRFGFDPAPERLYVLAVPMLVLMSMDGLVPAFELSAAWMVGAAMAAALLWPAVHARLKSVQHGQARYGRHRFSYTPAVLPFYGLYLRLVGWGILAVALTFMVGMVLASDAARAGKAPPVWFFLASAGASLAAWLVAWPFFATRLQQVIWPRTQLGPVRFSASLRGWPMLKLVLGQTLLVLLTAGLYWPWAAVAMAKRRVESIAVHAPEPLHAMQFEATSSQGRGGATGDSAAEVFGLDLGW